MSLTYTEAYDEMLAAFKAAWDTTGYNAIYEDVASDGPPTSTEPWARVTIRHSPAGGQVSLSSDTGTRIFSRSGIIIVSVFTPVGDGLSLAHSLGKIVADAFDGVSTPGRVLFRDVGLNEIGPDGDFFQTNVTAAFEYDEVK